MLVHVFAMNGTGQIPKNTTFKPRKTGRIALNAMMAISVAAQPPFRASGRP
jgi:hypothetical protein